MTSMAWLSVWLLLAPALAWSGVSFDGVDDTATTGVALSNFLSNTTGTTTVWVTPTGAAPAANCNAAGSGLIAGDTQGFWKIARRQTHNVCGTNADGATDAIETTYTNDAPTHLALVHTGGNILFYKDGVAIGAPVASGNTSALTNAVIVGGGGVGGAHAYLEGRIDHVAFYAVALTAEEILAKAASRAVRLGRTTASGEWELTECGDGAACNGVVSIDISGNGRSLTFNDGANNTGVTGRGSPLLTNPYGVQ